MLKLIPEVNLQVIERCSGHGGSWGYKHANFETALKVGAPVARQARQAARLSLHPNAPSPDCI